jgi:succinoglycan biosynthesis transport protein ExoP
MLQRSRSSLELADIDQSSPPETGPGDMLDWALGFVRRQYQIVLFVAVLAAIAGVIYLHVTPPTYTAQANVLMGTQRSQFMQQQSLISDAPLDIQQLESQIQIIQSKGIASAVITQLKLEEDPEFSPSSLGAIRGALRWLRGSAGEDTSPDAAAAKKDALIAAFTDRLTVRRLGVSYVIEIGFSSRSPQRAAEIANAVANAYMLDQLESKYQASRTATSWLQDRLRELTQQVSAAERAALAFKAQNDIVAADGKLMDEQQVADLNSRLVAARAQTSDVLARLNRVQAIISAGPNTNLDAGVSDLSTNPIITNLRQQYLELSRREAEWSSRFGRDHLAVVNLRNRIRDIRTSTFDELQRLAETYKSEHEIAKRRLEEIEKQLAQAVSQSRASNTAQVTLRELDATAKGYRNLYENFLQRYMGSVQQESFPMTEARIISAASPPPSKSKPKTALVLGFSIVGGIGLGVALGLLRDMMDRVFRTPSQIEDVLQIPCVALLPVVKNEGREALPRQSTPTDNLNERLITRDSSVLWTVVASPLSRFAEAVRSIKLAISLNTTGGQSKIVGFTSSVPNEGKSTIAASLAHLIAQVGGRVILVDCDLRNPSLSSSLAPGASIGIVDVVSGERALEEAIWKDSVTNLAFLPSVKRTRLLHTSEILAAEATKTLFERLRATYDYVIVDLPPLAPIVDVRATTNLVDCFLLVVEWGSTKIDVVQHALNSAPNVREALIGAVLNKANMDFMARYDVHSGDYYRNKYGARYGYTD